MLYSNIKFFSSLLSFFRETPHPVVLIFMLIQSRIHVLDKRQLDLRPLNSIPPPRPLRHRLHQKRNRIIHHVRRKPVPDALIHPIIHLHAPVRIPPARRVLQHPNQRLGIRIRHQLVGAARAQQELLPPHAAVQDAPQPVLFRRGERHRRNSPRSEQNALGIAAPDGGDRVGGKVSAPQEARLVAVQLGGYSTTAQQAYIKPSTYIVFM